MAKLTDKASKALNEILEVRSKGRCEIRKAKDCNGRWEHRHHKLRAGQGGDWDAENIVCACFPCHTWVHANPAQSYELGFLIRMSANL